MYLFYVLKLTPSVSAVGSANSMILCLVKLKLLYIYGFLFFHKYESRIDII